MATFRGVLLATVLIAAPCWPAAKCPASTRCPVESYQLRGVVLAASGRPVPDARVSISWRGAERVQTLIATSDAEGRYSATVKFNSFAGEDQFGVLCLNSLQTVALSVTAANGLTAVKTVKVEQLRTDVRLVVSSDAGGGRPGAHSARRARWTKW